MGQTQATAGGGALERCITQQEREAINNGINVVWPVESASAETQAKRAAALHLLKPPYCSHQPELEQAVRWAVGNPTEICRRPFIEALLGNRNFIVEQQQAADPRHPPETYITLNMERLARSGKSWWQQDAAPQPAAEPTSAASSDKSSQQQQACSSSPALQSTTSQHTPESLVAAINAIWPADSTAPETRAVRVVALLLQLPPHRGKLPPLAAAVAKAIGSWSSLGIRVPFRQLLASNPYFIVEAHPHVENDVFVTLVVNKVLHQAAGVLELQAAPQAALEQRLAVQEQQSQQRLQQQQRQAAPQHQRQPVTVQQLLEFVSSRTWHSNPQLHLVRRALAVHLVRAQLAAGAAADSPANNRAANYSIQSPDAGKIMMQAWRQHFRGERCYKNTTEAFALDPYFKTYYTKAPKEQIVFLQIEQVLQDISGRQCGSTLTSSRGRSSSSSAAVAVPAPSPGPELAEDSEEELQQEQQQGQQQQVQHSELQLEQWEQEEWDEEEQLQQQDGQQEEQQQVEQEQQDGWQEQPWPDWQDEYQLHLQQQQQQGLQPEQLQAAPQPEEQLEQQQQQQLSSVSSSASLDLESTSSISAGYYDGYDEDEDGGGEAHTDWQQPAEETSRPASALSAAGSLAAAAGLAGAAAAAPNGARRSAAVDSATLLAVQAFEAAAYSLMPRAAQSHNSDTPAASPPAAAGAPGAAPIVQRGQQGQEITDLQEAAGLPLPHGRPAVPVAVPIPLPLVQGLSAGPAQQDQSLHQQAYGTEVHRRQQGQSSSSSSRDRNGSASIAASAIAGVYEMQLQQVDGGWYEPSFAVYQNEGCSAAAAAVAAAAGCNTCTSSAGGVQEVVEDITPWLSKGLALQLAPYLSGPPGTPTATDIMADAGSNIVLRLSDRTTVELPFSLNIPQELEHLARIYTRQQQGVHVANSLEPLAATGSSSSNNTSSSSSGTAMFGPDNRMGIPGTLHRVSAMCSKQGAIYGLTYRIGRHVPGAAVLLADALSSMKASADPSSAAERRQCLLLLGRPGVGKTSLLRDIARLMSLPAGQGGLGLSVVVLDTNNDIAGDAVGRHAAVGHARRLMVPQRLQQAELMLGAAANHHPDVLLVDEVATQEEVVAARIIAQRGVLLVAAAHSTTLAALLRDPYLSPLVGGVKEDAVAASDNDSNDTAQETVRRVRAGPATFAAVLEMQAKNRWLLHLNAEASIDKLLASSEASHHAASNSGNKGQQQQQLINVQLRSRDSSGRMLVEMNTRAGLP